ncbi:hypothetical protein AB1Y20_018477 [Prymnesium parvum]|uniref:CS domain-containing protein n=1 Tax=Prymnesium parvum TaxID=97485 RepID=A0AB34JH61_PRYPA
MCASAAAARSPYYYWHAHVPTGADAAPKPTPQLLSSRPSSAAPLGVRAIDRYALLDEGGDCLKLLLRLDAELEHVDAASVEAEFGARALTLSMRSATAVHRLHVPVLSHEILPEKCTVKVSKARRVVLTLAKRDASRTWKALRLT